VVLRVARSEERLREQLSEVLKVLVLGLPLVIALAGLGGYLLARRALAPIDHLAVEARRVTAERLHERVSVPNEHDEIGRLAAVINDAFARLEASFDKLRRFTADASHELRTPVSIVRATADVTLSRAHRHEGEYREALAIVGEQARRVGRLVDDMLVLARADAGGYPLRPVDLYLDEVVADCRRAVDVLAAERGVTIRSSGAPEIPFRGDEDQPGADLNEFLISDF
jgi:signal transduction histidine kinase